jgi:hypothetical protein
MVRPDRYQVYEKWVKSKDCFIKPTPPNTSCKRCFEGKHPFCRYPIVDDVCGKDWKKPTRLELMKFKMSKNPKDKSIQSASSSLPPLDHPPIASSSNSKGKARAIQTPIVPPPPTSTIFPTAALLGGIEAQTATLLQALNTIINNQVALYQMLARHYGEQEDPEDGVDDADGGSEEGD